jgi:hypothetical protein
MARRGVVLGMIRGLYRYVQMIFDVVFGWTDGRLTGENSPRRQGKLGIGCIIRVIQESEGRDFTEL